SPSVYTNQVTFTANLTPETGASTTPVTGTVRFTLDSFPSVDVAINNNSASWTWNPAVDYPGNPPTIPAGKEAIGHHLLTVDYLGDANNTPATGTPNPLTQTIRDVDHPPFITSSPSTTQNVDVSKSIKVFFTVADDDSPLSSVTVASKFTGTGIVTKT